MVKVTAQNTDSYYQLDTDRYYQLGCKLNQLTSNIDTVIDAVVDCTSQDTKMNTVKVSVASVQAVKESMLALKKEAEIPETWVARFVRELLNLVGIVTIYQQILIEVEEAEKKAEGCLALAELVKYEKAIAKKTDELNAEFGSFAEELNFLKVRVANISQEKADFFSCHEQLNDLQLKFRACNCDINMLLKHYRGDISVLSGIKTLGDRAQAFKETLEKIGAQLNDVLAEGNAVRTESIKIGGIQNGGNTCYIATALQVLNAVPSYRNLFDPQKNPLSLREKEAEDSLVQRKAIQASCFDILNKISAGTTTSKQEINAFRKICYAHEIVPGKRRIVEDTSGQQDGEEVLYNLLEVVGYEEPSLTFEYQYFVQDEEDYVSVELPNADPKGYSTLEEAKKGFTEAGELSLSATQYGDGSVLMKTLVRDFWKKETLEKRVFVHRDTETGTSSFREYRNVTKVVKFSATSVIPEVLRVFIPQYSDKKAKIVVPDVIYPFNKTGAKLMDQTDNGRKYSLVAAAEHMPGHYVAHVRKDRRFIQISDDSVTEDPSSDFPARLYIYTLVNEERSSYPLELPL